MIIFSILPDINRFSSITDSAKAISGDIIAKSTKLVTDRESGSQVSTGGIRNERPLSKQQKSQALAYAMSLGLAEDAIVFSDNMNTCYNSLFGQDILYIGTDALPVTGSRLSANSRISMRGVIAHELIGHRLAELAGRVQPDLLLEEVQASIRAARFAPDLSLTERVTLIRDALERLHKADIKIREVKNRLWIDSAQ